MVSNIDESTRNAYVAAGYHIIRGELGPLNDALGGLEIVLSDNWGAEEVPKPDLSRVDFCKGDNWSDEVITDAELTPYDLYAAVSEKRGQLEFHWLPDQRVLSINSCDLIVIAKDDYKERMDELVLATEKMAFGLCVKVVEYEELHDQEKEYFLGRPDYTLNGDRAFKKM